MPTAKVIALLVKGDPGHSTSRTVEEVRGVFEEVNKIWGQAGLSFRAEVLEWRPRPDVIDDVVGAALRRQADVGSLGPVTGTSPRHVTAIYVRSIGGSSGKVFRSKKTVVVVDETKVSVSRTTAHEIGHLFGLETG